MIENAKKDLFEEGTNFYSISQIFKEDNERYFVIPNYQRGYAWNDSHVDALWNDICRIVSSEEKHYMGVLAITKTKEDVKNKLGLSGEYCYDIIDGQQRITTIIILLSVLRGFVEDVESIIIPSQYKYRLNYEIDGNNKEFFLGNIYGINNNNPHNAYQKNMINAKNNLYNKVCAYENKNELYNSIINKLVFNLYSSIDEFDARKTFETMNYRGKPLTYLELLKNKLIYLSTKQTNQEHLINQITTCWETIYDNLGKNPDKMLKDDEFLKAHWFIFGKSEGNLKEKGDSCFHDILDRYFSEGYYDYESNGFKKNDNISEQMILEYIYSLKDCSNWWKCVMFPIFAQHDIQLDKSEVVLLDKLSRIKKFGFVNALLLATLANSRFITTEKRFRLYEVLEKFIFINFCVRSSRSKTNDLSFCNAYSKQIYNTKNTAANDRAIDELINKLINTHEKIAIKNQIYDVLRYIKEEMNINCYKNFRDYGLKYFLFEWNRKWQNSGRNALILDWDKFELNSIEHVLPQKANKAESWRIVLDRYSPEEINIITNALGNLVGLTSNAKNSSLKNYSFYIKSKIKAKNERACYKKGTVAEILISDEPYWTVKEIYNRTKEMLNFMFDTWFNEFLDSNSKEEVNNNIDSYIGFSIKETDVEQDELCRILDVKYTEEYNAFKSKHEIEE